MKTTMKLLAAGTFATLFFLVGNVNAEGKQANASGRENSEETLQVEKWMTDENVWNTGNTGWDALATESENSLQIEEWMTDTYIWKTGFELATDTETALQIEDWMTNTSTWNESTNRETDNALVFENWMIENNVWNR